MPSTPPSSTWPAVAASSVTDPRVTWIQSRAESVDRLGTEPVDAVICNSAIWQTDLAATSFFIARPSVTEPKAD